MMTELNPDKNRRILVIDDNRAIHDDFRKILSPGTSSAALDAAEAELFGQPAGKVRAIGYEVDSALQGQEGLLLVQQALAARRPYAMAFVDVRMPPGWDGVETTRKIWEVDPEIQIVICTAYADYSWDEMFEQLGNSDGLVILKKPFDTVEALQLAQALTEKWWLHRQSRNKMEELERMVAARTSALARSFSLLNATLESTTDGIVAVDLAGRMVSCNQKFADTWRFPAGMLDRRDAAEMRAYSAGQVNDPAMFLRRVKELEADPEAEVFDVIEHQDGRIFERYIFPQRINRECVGVVISWRDITMRKQAEMALAESQSRYHSLFENMLEGYAYCETVFEGDELRDFIYLEVNATFEKLTGLKDVVGKKVTEVIPGVRETSGELFEVYRRVVLTGRSERCEIYLESLGIWFSIAVYSREKKHFVAVFDNITERKQAESLVLQSEERYRSLIDNASDAIFTIAADGTFTTLNPAVEIIAGLSRTEWLGKPFAAMVHPDDLPLALEMFHRIMKGEPAPVHELRGHPGLKRPATMEMTLAAQKDERGEIIGLLGIGRDITERKRVERQVKLQNTINRALAEASIAEEATPKILQAVCENFDWDVSALWSVDPQDHVLRCAEIWSAPALPMEEFKTASRQMTFAPNVGLPGRVWASAQPAWIGDVIKDGNFPRVAAANEVGLHAAFAFPILTGKDVSGVIEFFSREVRADDEGLLRGLGAVGIQLGQFFQRQRLEAQLFQSQKMETVGKLAGGIAHEFNSILTAIIGQGELLLEDLPAESPPTESAKEIIKAAMRAATLTRQLLAYGRKQFLRPEELDLNQVLSSMGGVMGHLMADVEVKLVPAARLPLVKADAGQLEQVIMNMAMNARDAMPNGGRLTLETASVTFDTESVGKYSELKPGGYVMLAISDTGTGMSEEVKARAFEPFFSTKGVGQGTGLGLSTCYGIVKQSGGHISLYSEIGRGTTFKIYLPLVDALAKSTPQHPDSARLPRGTETVLLVEDDPALREMAATLLKRLGYTVLTAADGVEALSVSHQPGTRHIDLLFTDVVMPHMSGSELADRVRAIHPQTKILFASAYTEQAIIHQGVLVKSVALLQSPFTPSALAKKLRDVLDLPQ